MKTIQCSNFPNAISIRVAESFSWSNILFSIIMNNSLRMLPHIFCEQYSSWYIHLGHLAKSVTCRANNKSFLVMGPMSIAKKNSFIRLTGHYHEPKYIARSHSKNAYINLYVYTTVPGECQLAPVTFLKFILFCDFDTHKLPAYIPVFYKECLDAWLELMLSTKSLECQKYCCWQTIIFWKTPVLSRNC